MPIRIVLADDHAVLRNGLKTAIEAEPGLVVEAEAEDGRAAVKLARQFRPNVVVMDVTMPELNGIDATQQIVSDLADVYVLALSMHRELGAVQQMLRAGAIGYVVKQRPVDELCRAIRSVADGRSFLSPEVADVVLADYRGGNGHAGNGNGKRTRRGNGRSSNGNGRAHTADDLSSREREVLQLIAEGHATKTIAVQLCLSPKTIETHRQRLMNKLQIHSIAELTKFAVREGLTTLEV